jgi:NADPH2 dehydrogenase
VSKLFSPYQIKDLTCRNRIVMSPMVTNSADDNGNASDWHFIHYVSRALGGVGLVMLEASAVEPRGRLYPNDLGIWSDEHKEGLAKIAKQVHENGAKIGIQLFHAGRKGRVKTEEIVAPSPIAFNERSQTPKELTKSEIGQIVMAYQAAAKRALDVGIDVIEIHAAHGYLINEFLSPLTNKRVDEYGGTFENRLLFLREIIRSIKEVWPESKPLFVRISADEYDDAGLKIEDHIEIARILKNEGVDLIDCSSGGVLPIRPDSLGPGYQVSYAEKIRKGASIATSAVGLLYEPALAEEVIRNERADLIFIGRALLNNPFWALEASRKLGADLDYWPKQYLQAKDNLAGYFFYKEVQK